MSKMNVEKFRKRVLEEKARLEADRARLVHHPAEPMSQGAGELGDFDPNHPGDNAEETFERAKDVALTANVDGQLAQIEEALSRLDEGSYGTCQRCGKAITEARLEALPFATLCIDCQAYVENVQ